MQSDVHHKYIPRFWTVSGAANTPKWIASNYTLARLLEQNRQQLSRAITIAKEIQAGLDILKSFMDALCRRTCQFCPEPCCICNTVWFDFRDLILLHLLKAPIPGCQAAMDPRKDCPFLYHHGCRLPFCIRPWMCIQYICPTQFAIVEKKGRSDSTALLGRIKRIEKQRLDMEAEVLRQIKGPSKK